MLSAHFSLELTFMMRFGAKGQRDSLYYKAVDFR
jgi:hypothetical protein